MNVNFDKKILIPSNFKNLTSENDGPEYFEVKLLVHPDNWEIFAGLLPSNSKYFEKMELDTRRLEGANDH